MITKILLVEDHDIVRQGIRALLEGEKNVEVAGEASNGAMALSRVRDVMPDIVIIDMNMPVMNGLECTRRLKKDFPSIKVLVLSMLDHESYLIDMLDAGADGYILKNTNKDELLFAIRKVANGSIYIGAEFTLSMLAKYKAADGFIGLRPESSVKLNEREMDVLQLIADGHTNHEIAERLFSSRRTIETRRKKLLEKTGTHNTATLIRFAVLNGFIR